MSSASEPKALVTLSDRAWRVLVLVALAAVVVGAAVVLAAVVVPVLLAALIVPVGRPAQEWLCRRMPPSVAAALVLLCALAVLVAAVLLMSSSIAANWDALRAGLADAVTVATDWIGDQVSGLDDQQLASVDQNLRDLMLSTTNALVGGLTNSVTALGALVVGFVLFLMTFFFGVRDWHKFHAWALDNAAPTAGTKVDRFFDRYSTVLRQYWKAQALLGAFDATALGLGLWLIGVPLAGPIAILTFVISFIPYVGAIVAGAIAVFVTLGINGVADAAIVLVLSLLVFNTGENLMRPWLVRETVRMPTFVAFIAGTTGILVAGAFGAIVAIPLVALAGEVRNIFFNTDQREITAVDSAPES